VTQNPQTPDLTITPFSGLNLLNEPIKSLPKEQLAPLSGKKSSQFRLHEDSI
jgi:hypothetical protein